MYTNTEDPALSVTRNLKIKARGGAFELCLGRLQLPVEIHSKHIWRNVLRIMEIFLLLL